MKRSHRLQASWPARQTPTRQLTRRRQSKKASSSSWSSHPPGAPPPLPRLTGDSGPSAGGLPPSSPLLLPLLLGRVLPLAARLRLGWKSHSRVCPGPTCKETGRTGMHIDHLNPASTPDHDGRVRGLPCHKPQLPAHSPARLSVGLQHKRSCHLPPQMEGRSPHRWRHRWHSAPQTAAGGPCTG